MKKAKIKYFEDCIVFFVSIIYLCRNPQKTTTMKRVILAFCLLLLCVGPTQAARKNRHAIGPMLGYQTAQLSYFRGNIQSDFSQNFTAGIFARFYQGKVYIQPELLYFNTSNLFNVTVGTGGFQSESQHVPPQAQVEVTLNSMNLQFPLLVGCDLIDLRLLRLRAHAGPTANYVLSSKVFLSYAPGSPLQTSQPFTEDFDPRHIAWGFQAGLGLDVLNKIYLDVNYNFGLTGMYKRLCETQLGQYFDFSNLEESRLNMFMVTVGVKLF